MKITKHYIPFLALLTACSSTSRKDPTTGPALAVGVGAMVLASPAIPVVEAIRKVDGRTERSLSLFEIYQSQPKTFVIPNPVGWFTSENSINDVPISERKISSAWVVDLENSPRDRKGRIILNRDNLRLDYLEKVNITRFTKIDRGKKLGDSTRFFYKKGRHTLYIVVDGEAHPVMITQKDEG